MAKYYRVIKDHPLWEKGAIISNKDYDGYGPIHDFWVKDLSGDTDYNTYTEGPNLVEHQPDWFERVYPVSVLKRTHYLSKAKAKEYHKKVYKEGSNG